MWTTMREGLVDHTFPTIRFIKSELTDDSLHEALDKAAKTTEGDFNKFTCDTKARGKELYDEWPSRINKKQKSTASGIRNGFELYRRIAREEDPITETTAYSLRLKIPGICSSQMR